MVAVLPGVFSLLNINTMFRVRVYSHHMLFWNSQDVHNCAREVMINSVIFHWRYVPFGSK